MPNEETNIQVQEPEKPESQSDKNVVLPDNKTGGVEMINKVFKDFELQVLTATDRFTETGLVPIVNHYEQLVDRCGEKVIEFLKQIKIAPPAHVADAAIRTIIGLDLLIKETEERGADLQLPIADALDLWRAARNQAEKGTPQQVEYVISAKQLNVQPDDDKVVRKYKNKRRLFLLGRKKVKTEVPVRQVAHHYFSVAIKPAFHSQLGEFVKGNHQINNDLRKELSRKLKSLVISIDKSSPSEQSEIIDQQISEFTGIISHFKQQTAALAHDFKRAVTAVVKATIQEAGTMALTPGASEILRYRERHVNHKALDELNARLKQFSTTWLHNQTAFYNQLRAELWFTRLSLTVYRLAIHSGIAVEREFFNPVEENLSLLEKTLHQIKETLKQNELPEVATSAGLNEQLYLGAEAMISKLENTTDLVSQVLPESFDLLKIEDSSPPTVYTAMLPSHTIALSRIADYLVKTNFTQNHQQALMNLSQQVKQINSRIINNGNLIIYSQDIASEEQQRQVIAETIERISKELIEIKASIKSIRLDFAEQLASDQNATLASLDLKAVVIQADQLQQYVSREEAAKPVNQWMERKMRHLKNRWRKLGLFIVRRRHDVVVARHHRKHEKLLSDGERIQNFMESLRLTPEIDQQLPYYYKQLFSGKHLSNAAGVRIRKNEISRAKKVVDRIERGAGGALVITGDAMTGITFLTNYIATQLISGKVYQVPAPPGGSHRESDLHKAIIEQVGKKRGNVYSTLASLEPGAVFIFHDLEQWWLKYENGDEALKALTQIIDRFGRKFYFLLACNSFTFRLISKAGTIDNYLASTIVIAPATLDEMREIIWLRHTTGGMKLEYAGKKSDGIHGKHWEALFKRFYKKSNGNIGLALRLWLLSIKSVKEETIVIDNCTLDSFPNISNNDWKVLIYQLFLHRSIGFNRLKLIFEDEDPQWLKQNLSALIRFGVIEETSRHCYTLNSLCRPYIEKWFNEKNLI